MAAQQEHDNKTYLVHVTFEDVLLGEPTLVAVDVDECSRLFPYRLRQQLHDIKRVPPHRQFSASHSHCDHVHVASLSIFLCDLCHLEKSRKSPR